MAEEEQQENIDEIIRKIFSTRGFDVRNYRTSDLQRRIGRRMDVLDISSLTEYSEYLEANPNEYEALFNTILVNVTRFFRDPEAWSFLEENILPDILKEKDEIRIWSAGCSSGEEPYSVAIVLAEMLGDNLYGRAIKLYATDIDETALRLARSGTYRLDQLTGLSEDMRNRHFSRHGDLYTIDGDIRRLIIFSRHNLLSDPPMSHIDLLICRNVLIYLDQALQSRIASKLQYAVRDTGYLWLGKAEMSITGIRGLKPLNTEWRFFKKIRSSTYPQYSDETHTGHDARPGLMNTNGNPGEVTQETRMGIIILDKVLNVVMCNQIAGEIWGLQHEELLGKPFPSLHISYCPVDLRHRIQKAAASGEPLVVDDVEHWITKERRIYLRIEIIPVASQIMIFLEDITELYEMRWELQTTNRALEAGTERLLSANEELKVSNTQLQYINEELKSTNEELEATSQEQISRIAELSKLNQHYEKALSSIDLGIIVADTDLLVRAWNGAAAHMFGKSEDEVKGKHLVTLDIGLSPDQLAGIIKTGEPVTNTLEFLDQRGGKSMADISIFPLMDGVSEDLPLNEAEGLVLVVKGKNSL